MSFSRASSAAFATLALAAAGAPAPAAAAAATRTICVDKVAVYESPGGFAIAYLYRPQTLRVLGTARPAVLVARALPRRPARVGPDEQALPVSRASDQELVRRLRAGDTAAWDVLDHRYRRPLERFARRMLHDVAPDQVEDVVQEALWRAHRALQRDTRVLEMRPWLYRLTRNCCLDERARVRTDAVELERAAGVADHAGGPAAILERRGALRTLLDDLARLPELQRHALLRRELDGLSHDELAVELGLTAGATRSLVHRARGALTRAAEGRALGCHDVRSDILEAHDRRRRPTARTLRHLATCPTCRALQSALRSQRRSLAALAPPLGLLAALGGFGIAGWHAKATAIGTSAVLAASVSVELFQAGDPAPLALQSIALPGKRVAAGAPLPDGVAVVRGEVRYPDVRTLTLACPPGLRLADLLPPQGGRVSARYAPTTTIGTDRSGEIVLSGTARDVDVTVAALCRRPNAAGSIVDPSNRATS